MFATALVELNRCSLCLRPPKKKQHPNTSSMLLNTDPSNEAWRRIDTLQRKHHSFCRESRSTKKNRRRRTDLTDNCHLAAFANPPNNSETSRENECKDNLYIEREYPTRRFEFAGRKVSWFHVGEISSIRDRFGNILHY